MPDTLELIRNCVPMADGVLARSGEVSREELLHIMGQISSTSRPTLIYSIARQRRGHRRRQQQG